LAYGERRARDADVFLRFEPPSGRRHDDDVRAHEPLPPVAVAEARFPATLTGALADSKRRVTMNHPIVSRDAWLEARKALLAKERAMTHALDELRAERRQLPWVRIEKPYVFEGPEGKCRLGDLFGGRSQLAIYHFMLTPGSDHVCPGCSFVSDHIDAARQHFEHADLSFAAVSRVPLQRIEAVKARMGWTFPWLSSQGSDFNHDFAVSFTPEELAEGRAIYNYGTVMRRSQDMFGVSIFVKEGDAIFHSYSTYHRGAELLMGAFNWLDLTPKGRNESAGTMSWVRLHDQY
jgi:predicted dithiol-disulfide oxidoreductase (DUF899 family)